MKHKLSALILLFCIIFSDCAMAAEQMNLRKSEEERKAEFNQALSEIPYNVSDFDKISFQDGLKRSKNNFTRLYRSQWKSLGMTEKLERSVNTAFDENTKDLTWGTAGVQIAANRGNIIDKIQEAVAFKFAEAFDDFLRELENKWGETLQKDVADFYRRTSVSILASDRNPMIQAYIRSSSAAQDKGFDVMKRVQASLEQEYPDIKLSGAKFAGGVITLLLRKQIQKAVVKQLGKTALKKATTSALGKAAGMAVGYAVPAIMVAWSVWDFASIAWNAPDEVRAMLQESNKSMYYNEIPEIYWDAMEPYVMDTFVDEFGKIQKIKEEAAVLAKNPVVYELTFNLTEEQAAQFNERISALSRLLGRSDYDELLKDFGELIRDLPRRDFETLARMLQNDNKLHIKQWLAVADKKYFDLYNSLPQDIWANFPPNKQSLEALTWIMKLPPKARNTAVKLSTDDIDFLINGMPERFIPQLLSSKASDDPDVIHAEIVRLSRLPDIETRQPYQSSISYYGTLYGFYFRIFVIIIAVLIILKIVLSFKKGSKQTPAAQNNPVVINIPSQPYPAMPTEPVKKIKITAKISPRLADELKTITWDVSQKILPSDDGGRILSVEVENLDNIASWLSKYKNEIEILQPEELKRKLN